jgi:hypothetical protein
MNALKHRLRPFRAASAVLLSVALLAVSAPALVPDASACQSSSSCGS